MNNCNNIVTNIVAHKGHAHNAARPRQKPDAQHQNLCKSCIRDSCEAMCLC